ncbi:MAG: CoA-binding protein [Candidatus Helarchaeota archaeon]
MEIKKHALYPLFFPKNVVIVGASPTPNMGVSLYLDSYKKNGIGIEGFPKVYPLNPKYAGMKINDVWTCYPDLKSIPESSIDIVICCINARYVADLLRDCIENRVKFLVIYTSGFSEVGKRGLRYYKKIKEILKVDQTTRIIGPNCFGPINSKINFNYSRIADLYPGDFSFISQSGGFANTLIEHSESRGIGINAGVSIGNMIDLDVNDFLDYFYQDPNTKIIGIYLEGVQNKEKAQKFLQLIKKINQEKPIIIFKGGRTQKGVQAILSHTGAIAGSQEIYEGAFKQTGVTSVKNGIEFYDCVHLFSKLFPSKLPKGKNACLIVPGGGFSVEMADIFSKIGLKIPPLSDSTGESLSKMLFDVNTSFKNPIDVGAYGILPEMFLNTIKIILKEDQYDILIPYLQVSRIHGLKQNAYKGFGPMFGRSLGRMCRKTEKTLILINRIDQINANTVIENNQLKKNLEKFKIPFFPSIPRAAKALEYLLKYVDYQNKIKKIDRMN